MERSLHFNDIPLEPSLCVTLPNIPCSVSLTIAAPAPSANKIQVERSFQSTIFDNVSAPITNAVLASPERIYASAVCKAYTKPEHAAFRSKQVAFTAPILSCTIQDMLGVARSGDNVANKIRSISFGSIPAFSIAANAASVAI